MSRRDRDLYEASFALPGEGGYALKVVDTTRDRTAILPFTVPYPAEYRATGVDEETLRRIAAATGGRYLTDEILPRPDPERLAVRYVDLHAHLLLAALSVFLPSIWRCVRSRGNRLAGRDASP